MTNSNSDEAIRAIIEARVVAVHMGDVEAIVANVADDVVMFDVTEPLRRDGKASSRARAEEWIASYEGPINWENSDISIVTGDSVAFSHALSRVTGKLKTGTDVDMWFRTTLGFRRVGNRWLIVHDHGSAPFDPVSGKASLGLKP